MCIPFSECNDGYFGPNCIESCKTTCKSCNKMSGICNNGCKPGWRGIYCQEGDLMYFRSQFFCSEQAIDSDSFLCFEFLK